MDNSGKIILHLCAKSGSDSRPYRDAGYDVRIIGEEIGVENYTPPDNVYGIIANPPCTHFSIARTTAKTPRDLRKGMHLVKECLRVIWECQSQHNKNSYGYKPVLKFWMIENPATGFLKWFLGNPVFQYCHSEYGDNHTKKTAIWGMFNIPYRPLLSIPVRNKSIGNGWNMWDKNGEKRSICSPGFARAFFDANR